ncbi:HAD family phosphatase [Labilibacter sediminis]|nr:HAD family phosphatase [Labilibacter sediminis]
MIKDSSKILTKHQEAKAFIFDLDGTLADSMPVYYKVWKDILAQHNVMLTKELFDSMAGVSLTKCINFFNEQYSISLEENKVLEKVDMEVKSSLHLIHPIIPVCNLVHMYFEKIPMAIGTGSQKENAHLILQAIGLDQYFNIVVSAEDVANHKPSPDTFLKCSELMGIDPKYCQVFEDAKNGFDAALSAGMLLTDVTPYYKTSEGVNIY